MSTRYGRQSHVSRPLDRSLFDGALRPCADEAHRTDALIASPTLQAHAAMLERLPGGDLGMVWFGGTQEGVGDISIWFSRLADDAETWSAPRRLSDDAQRSEQNPVLFAVPGGPLWLLYTAQFAGDQDTAEVRRRVSSDDGASWSEAETLFPATADGGVFIRQPLVVTTGGRWLLPVFRCRSASGEKWSGDFDTSAVMVSDDLGTSWREVPVPESVGCVHMSIVQLADGTLHALFRSRWADSIYESRSQDEGDTWSPPVATALPNNNSSLQHRVLHDGSLALVYNHSSRVDASARRVSLYDEIDEHGLVAGATTAPGAAAPTRVREAFWGAPRAPLTLAISQDGGASWDIRGDLDQGDGYCLTNNSRDALNREFSYPVLCERPDGDIDVAYTIFRQTIKHARVSRRWRGPGS